MIITVTENGISLLQNIVYHNCDKIEYYTNVYDTEKIKKKIQKNKKQK